MVAAAQMIFEAVRVMIRLAMSGEIAGTVTAPIHKEALVLAGHHFPGHTEIFAHFTGTSDFTMMLAAVMRAQVLPASAVFHSPSVVPA